MNYISNFFGAVAQYFNNNETMAGAEAVVTDFTERQNLPEQAKEVVGTFDEVERVTVSGVFNENVVANIKIDIGEYGTYSVTVDIEDELPELMDSLNLEVADLPDLVKNGESIPLVRDGGEWRIRWEELSEWDLFSPDEESGNSTEQED